MSREVLLRSAAREDAPAVARVHVRSWQAAYRGLLPQDYLDRLRPQDRAQHYDFAATDPRKPATIVAVEGEAVVGFATVAAARDPDVSDAGELCALYVDPQWWGQHVGSALIAHGRARLEALGFRDAVLWVLAGNARAQRFYDRDGWRRDGAQRTACVWGMPVEEIRFRRLLQPAGPKL